MFSLGITTSKTYEEVREGEKQEASGIEKWSQGMRLGDFPSKFEWLSYILFPCDFCRREIRHPWHEWSHMQFQVNTCVWKQSSINWEWAYIKQLSTCVCKYVCVCTCMYVCMFFVCVYDCPAKECAKTATSKSRGGPDGLGELASSASDGCRTCHPLVHQQFHRVCHWTMRRFFVWLNSALSWKKLCNGWPPPRRRSQSLTQNPWRRKTWIWICQL